MRCRFLLFFMITLSMPSCMDRRSGRNIDDQSAEITCKVSDARSFIEVMESNRKRGFILDAAGITFRVWPSPYAKKYNDVKTIRVSKQKNLRHVEIIISEEGKEYSKDKGIYVEEVGMISEECWEKVDRFLVLTGKAELITQ